MGTRVIERRPLKRSHPVAWDQRLLLGTSLLLPLLGLGLFVITSYSIHYTKLYDIVSFNILF